MSEGETESIRQTSEAVQLVPVNNLGLKTMLSDIALSWCTGLELDDVFASLFTVELLDGMPGSWRGGSERGQSQRHGKDDRGEEAHSENDDDWV